MARLAYPISHGYTMHDASACPSDHVTDVDDWKEVKLS
jgi:hypothetical protein